MTFKIATNYLEIRIKTAIIYDAIYRTLNSQYYQNDLFIKKLNHDDLKSLKTSKEKV